LAQHADAVDVSGEILDPDTKLERDIKLASHGVGESRLQITAMHRPIRRTVATFGLVTQWNAHNLASRAARHHPDCLWRDRDRCQPFTQPESNQDAAGIRRKLEPGTRFFQFLGLLENSHTHAGASERERSRQPANAGASD